MTDAEINNVFDSLWGDLRLAPSFPIERPLLAHYSSIATLESIAKNQQLWFSNPLHMNDLEEVRFGIFAGANAFRENQRLRDACGSLERFQLLSRHFEDCFTRFVNDQLFDTYVLCFAEHEPDNNDGLLSMWRGYGGNGHAAAIIFDLKKIDYKPGGQPLIMSRVRYGTNIERTEWVNQKIIEFSELINTHVIPNEKLYIAAYYLFERLKIFALFSKHDGFKEEREWRAVFLKERDKEKRFEHMIDYSIGRHGVEPKFKLNIQPLGQYFADDLSLDKVVDRIILGPTTGSPLALKSVERMLNLVGQPGLAKKVRLSSIPFRP